MMGIIRGNRAAIELALKNILSQTYVYVLCRPNGDPFYVGKGTGRRIFAHEMEALQNHPIGESNPYKCNVIRKIIREGSAILYMIDGVYPLDQQGILLMRYFYSTQGKWNFLSVFTVALS